MWKKSLVLILTAVAFAPAADAAVMLQTHTTADTPDSGYNTTIISVISTTSEETIASVYAYFTGSMVQMGSGLYGEARTIDGPYPNYGSIDMDWDSHFLLSYDDISATYENSQTTEYYNFLWGEFGIDSGGQLQTLPLAQIVTHGDTTITYDLTLKDLTFTDIDDAHVFTGSFVTPEPASMVVLMLGGLGLAVCRRR